MDTSNKLALDFVWLLLIALDSPTINQIVTKRKYYRGGDILSTFRFSMVHLFVYGNPGPKYANVNEQMLF